jgi:hypothetical protein
MRDAHLVDPPWATQLVIEGSVIVESHGGRDDEPTLEMAIEVEENLVSIASVT